jgi:nicotinamidase-related amidase
MSNRERRDHSQSGRRRTYEPLTPESAVLSLVDHQSGLVSGIRDLARDEVSHNIVAFARAARVLRVPVVLTSTAPMMWA